ncbi:MAG: hypothetical protein ACP5XB_15110 [Isosphaeraceae bacterium]
MMGSPQAPSIVGKLLELATERMPLLAAIVSLALVPAYLVGSRPRIRRLARRPGFVASCATGLAIALFGLRIVVTLLAPVAFSDDAVSWVDFSEIPPWLFNEENLRPLITCAGLAVLASWMTLLVSGTWRARADWRDRLGWALGICWIVAFLVVALA